jgi:hypothetical protein
VDIPARGTVQITVTTQRRSFIAVDNVPDVPRQISRIECQLSRQQRLGKDIGPGFLDML